MVQYVDTVILTLYDSVMTPLASLRSLSLYWTMSDIQWMMAQPQYHCYNLPGYPYSADELYVGELLGGCASRLLWFNYFNPKDYPYVAVKGTFYVGYRNTDIGIRKHEILCIEENHEPPYAFTHDYRRKMSGVWEDEDHHIARWIPMLFPITLPEDEQPGGGNPENPDPDNPNPDNPPEGISEVAGAVGFTLRPNPAREEVTLEGGAWMSGGVLTVTDMRGTEVVRRKVESGRLTLDVSRLPKGAYTVSVTTSEGTVARRLVVQ